MKTCNSCKVTLPEEWFGKNRASKDGLNRRCKECNRKASQTWRNRNPENNVGSRLKYLYGISIEKYKELLKVQEGRCGICGMTEDPLGRRFAVDHCHETGKIRGLLCFSCNTGIGKLNTPELLDSAKKYLNDVSKGAI